MSEIGLLATLNLARPATARAAEDSEEAEMRRATAMFSAAFDAKTVEEEEAQWTAILEAYQCGPESGGWKVDACARAVGNRGNARSRMGKLDAALDDYAASIELAPDANEPRLNRGAALEAMGRYADAIDDYRFVLSRDNADPVAHNNLGNALMGLSEYGQARGEFHEAVRLAPEFSFAATNEAVAAFQLGDDTAAFRTWRSLLRRYPSGLDDARAALAAALWAVGETAQAEDQLSRVDDVRYKDKDWRLKFRRWPPRLEAAMDALIKVRPMSGE